MPLQAFLLCPDDSAAQLLSQELSQRGVEVERASDFMEAFDRLRQKNFDLILIDTTDGERALLLIHGVRTGQTNRRGFIIVLADPQSAGMRNFRDTGANMLLYQPLTAERVATGLDNAITGLRQERRISLRMPLRITLSITMNGHQEMRAEIEDCSEGGMSIRTAEPLPAGGPLKLQFRLPNSADLQEIAGEVIWKDLYGRSGIRFLKLTDSTRRLLVDCLRPTGVPREHGR
jgi:CheY-like chemotaxis protein